MTRPLIGLNVNHENCPESGRERYLLPAAYADRVWAAGGRPVLLPCVEARPEELAAMLAGLAGFLFIGGQDYPPALYGESPLTQTVLMAERRTQADLAWVKAALAADLPVLGICAGEQLFNLAAGGGLISHLPTATAHVRLSDSQDNAHDITIDADGILAGLYGRGRLRVNSSHHQAVNPARLGRGWRVTARADDGVVEAIEGPGRFQLGVQWHPERIDDEAHAAAIFSAYVQACG